MNVAVIAPGAADASNRLALGVNHVCFLVDDADAALARLGALGASSVAPAPPAAISAITADEPPDPAMC